jgi:hypothetical protein
MKTINLYFDMEFTSLSPDAQPISIGIVTDQYNPKYGLLKQTHGKGVLTSKSFYAEFSDFDINRCDDWVKKNVVSKLKYFPNEISVADQSERYECCMNMALIKEMLHIWLKQFSDYQIQFVCDCGTFDWYWMLQLLAIWDVIGIQSKADMGFVPTFKTGLPTLPINISPVPLDLNDVLACEYMITAKEAFDMNRDELAYGEHCTIRDTHNALWDAVTIMNIYNKY